MAQDSVPGWWKHWGRLGTDGDVSEKAAGWWLSTLPAQITGETALYRSFQPQRWGKLWGRREDIGWESTWQDNNWRQTGRRNLCMGQIAIAPEERLRIPKKKARGVFDLAPVHKHATMTRPARKPRQLVVTGTRFLHAHMAHGKLASYSNADRNPTLAWTLCHAIQR